MFFSNMPCIFTMASMVVTIGFWLRGFRGTFHVTLPFCHTERDSIFGVYRHWLSFHQNCDQLVFCLMIKKSTISAKQYN